jgi:hypothetical protein
MSILCCTKPGLPSLECAQTDKMQRRRRRLGKIKTKMSIKITQNVHMRKLDLREIGIDGEN